MTCPECGATVCRERLVGDKFKGVDCGCAGKEMLRKEAEKNMYSDLTLEHVHDERGNKVRVTSSRQLSEAQKRYEFASVVHSMNSENIDRAPVQKPLSVSDIYRRKFAGGR